MWYSPGLPHFPETFYTGNTIFTTLLTHNSNDIQGITIFKTELKISEFAGDTAVFLKDKSMANENLNTISVSSKASGLSLNIQKCKLLAIHTSHDSSIASIEVKSEDKYLGLKKSKNIIRRQERH